MSWTALPHLAHGAPMSSLPAGSGATKRVGSRANVSRCDEPATLSRRSARSADAGSSCSARRAVWPRSSASSARRNRVFGWGLAFRGSSRIVPRTCSRATVWTYFRVSRRDTWRRDCKADGDARRNQNEACPVNRHVHQRNGQGALEQGHADAPLPGAARMPCPDPCGPTPPPLDLRIIQRSSVR